GRADDRPEVEGAALFIQARVARWVFYIEHPPVTVDAIESEQQHRRVDVARDHSVRREQLDAAALRVTIDRPRTPVHDVGYERIAGGDVAQIGRCADRAMQVILETVIRGGQVGDDEDGCDVAGSVHRDGQWIGRAG